MNNFEVGEMINKINCEIQLVKEGKSNRSIGQLEFILNDLQKYQDSDNHNLVYPRFLVDEWDYKDELMKELMTFSSYIEKKNKKKCKRE